MTEKLLAVKKKVLQNVLCWILTRLVRSKFEAATESAITTNEQCTT